MGSPAKTLAWIFVLPVVLSGCSEEELAAPREVVRPVKTLVIPTSEGSGIRSFPARVESTRRAEVSFRVPGKVLEMPVKEGERVEEGQVIAKLDPTDYQLVVDDRQATMFRAKRDFDRAKPLADKGFLPKKEFDRREADMKSAVASLKRAQQDLNYTTLKAPFSGEISKRLIQNFEEVQAKQSVVELRDLSALEVKFDVPEQIMLRLTEEVDDIEPEIFASFDPAPGKKFPLNFREIATSADAATRTFEATYTMEAPKDILVLPGMTATVTVDLSQYLDLQSTIYVPVEAVVATNELDAKVWVVDEESMTVSPKPAKVGRLRGNSIAVTEGLEPGERIAIAGVPFLVDGMKITFMAMPEQAVEREDDAEIRRAAEKALQETEAGEQVPDASAQ